MQLILDLTYLNTACNLSLNTSDIKYNMFLKRAQLDLRETLGGEFYDQIVSQYPSYTGDNQTLYDEYIKDLLAWSTYGYYLKMSDFESTPTGMRSFNDDNSSLLTDMNKHAAEKNVLEFVRFYRNRMLNYISETQSNDSTKFPLYINCPKETYSFGITAIDKRSDGQLKINKAIISND